nr:hypothetical protein [Tanacetum cinerariifolium]
MSNGSDFTSNRCEKAKRHNHGQQWKKVTFCTTWCNAMDKYDIRDSMKRGFGRRRDNGANITKSIVEGPCQMGKKTVTLAGGVEGALQLGLPKDIYALINHYTDAKDIWDNVKMLLEGSETSSNTKNKATVKDRIVVVQDVRGRYNVNNQGRQFQRNNARGFVRTRNVGRQNRVGNLNPGQAKLICTDIAKIIRKPDKNGHENEKSTQEPGVFYQGQQK